MAGQVNKLTSAGCVFKFWVADWFAMLNNKVRVAVPFRQAPLRFPCRAVSAGPSCRVVPPMAQMDGDLKKIRIVGEYMIEVWKAAGMNMDNVEFLVGAVNPGNHTASPPARMLHSHALPACGLLRGRGRP
jgi:hypothetical protein